ncbi:Hsp70 family protein, partial [Actinophytocola sp.]|uniref:Hsp70 family protein n=1 Tax=Actinophytocola sp. TaxID=1872138 RepID=UPI002D7E30E0
MSFGVGVDIGGTRTTAATPDGRAVTLPSVVFAERDGTLVVGDDAERLAPSDPARVARRFIGRVGDGTPLRLGGLAVPAEALAARLVERAVARLAERGARVAVTHPAGWGDHRLTALRGAIPGDVLLLSAARAAALAQDARTRVAPGAVVAVHDLGASGCTAAVLRRTDRGFVPAGPTEEVEVGGLDFDEAVFEHVRSTVGPAWDDLDPDDPAVLGAVARLRRECGTAKEALSADTDVSIPVVLPGIRTEVRLTRAELEELVGPGVAAGADALTRALAGAGVAPAELAAALLVGGSARIPLVTQVVSERLGRPVTIGPDPQRTVAVGAALAARGPQVERTRVGLWPANWTPPPVAAPEPPPVTRPAALAGPPSPVQGTGLLRRLPRTAITAALAGTVAAVAVVAAMAMTMNRLDPSDAGAETVTKQIPSLPEPTVTGLAPDTRANQPAPVATTK